METTIYGWAGQVLEVDLSNRTVVRKPLDQKFARTYIGGSGFNSKTLFDLVDENVDALSPENVLLIGIGLLAGTLAPGSSRTTFTAKSPLTDAFGDSNMGGFFGTQVKFAGYDQVIITGKSEVPVYLSIDDEHVEIKDANYLWGMDTWQTARAIKEENHDPTIQVVCIGPAGENLVRYANIMCPTKRAAGRTGMGAVMGSKNLKAIAARGHTDIKIARPEDFLKVCREDRDVIINEMPFYEGYHTYGTPYLMDGYVDAGMLGVRNYQTTEFKNFEPLTGRYLKRNFYRSMRACAHCHIACGPYVVADHNGKEKLYGEGPEFGCTEMAVLWDCDDAIGVLKYNDLCNKLGMDVYSLGSCIAWAMECYEKGLIRTDEFDGLPLKFGDFRSIIEVIPKVAARQGIGDMLAEGEKRAPQKLGRGSEKFMYHVKGLSPIPTDPRSNQPYGLQFVTSSRGADHLKSNFLYSTYILRNTELGMNMIAGHDIRGKQASSSQGAAKKVKYGEDLTQVIDSVGLCTRTIGSIESIARLVSTATGEKYDWQELMLIGEKIFNIQKAFNARHGFTRKDDNFSVADKFEKEPLPDGKLKGQVFERVKMLNEYYQIRQWDVETGLQKREKLKALGLNEVIKILKASNALG